MSLAPVLSAVDAVLPPKKRGAPKKVSVKPLHPELEQLWRWGRATEVLGHQVLSTVAEERDEWFWSQVWLSPAQSLSAQKELREVPGFPATLMPFATDEAGNYTCHDVKSGNLVDWDHETRKTRKLAGNLAKVFTLVTKLAQQEKSAPAASVASPPSAEAAVPSTMRAMKSAALRKHSAHFRLHGFHGAAISPDGKLIAGMVYGTRNACFAELTSDKELIPTEPGFAASQKSMGFVQMSTGGFAFEGESLAWRMGEQLTLWRWSEGALTLERGAQWKKADPSFMEKVPLRLRSGLLAAAAIVKDKVQIALWPVEQFPKVKALARATAELKPKTVIMVGPWAGGELSFDLDSNGVVTTLESPEYLQFVITRWDAKTGKRLQATTLKDVGVVDLAVSPDGSATVLLTREGEVLVLDSRLAIQKRFATLKPKNIASAVRFDPSGTFFVTSALALGGKGGELAIWNARTLANVARLPVKEAVQGFQVRDVASGGLVTTSPLGWFELR